jgi:uncharacterized protein YndB with AHSA1/START domain
MSTDTAEYHFARDFTLPPAQLWHLLTDAQMRESWSGPGEGMIMTAVTTDLRRHGIERQRCGPADAPEFEVETRWHRVDAPNDAVFTESIEAGGQDIATSLVTYRLLDTAPGSTLHVTVAVSSFVGPEASAEFQAGWDTALSSLEAFAKTQTS